MANFYASIQFNYQELSFYQLYDESYDSTSLDNVNYKFNGYTYEDTLTLYCYSSAIGYYQAIFGGYGVTYDYYGQVTGGTATGFLVSANGSNLWGFEGFSYSAKSINQAILTPSTADDLAIISAIFSGNDNFNLWAPRKIARPLDSDRI